MAETLEMSEKNEEKAETTSEHGHVEKATKDNEEETEVTSDREEEEVVSEKAESSPSKSESDRKETEESEIVEDNGDANDDAEEKNSEEKGEDVVTLDDDGVDDVVPTVTIPDAIFYDSVSEEEKKYYEDNPISPDKIEEMKVQCTACFKQVNHHTPNSIQRHPVLGVPICRNCKHFYEEGDWEKDEEGSDVYCRWCGNGGEVLGCDKCKEHVFCKRCITRNCGRSKFAEINDSEEWNCFTCDPTPIFKERNLMFNLSKWATEKKKQKRKEKGTPKKEKMKVDKKRKREETQKQKLEEEISKVENFLDENIHEAFDTLAIYQKCLEDERKKWIKARKTMNANNAATAAKNLRKIYEITKQNMELLDHSLVEGYRCVFPEESDKKLFFSTEPKSPGKRRTKETSKRKESGEDDIEVEGVVINGEAVYGANGDDGDLDPSLLCSVEITASRESSSDPSPPTPRTPPKKKRKLNMTPSGKRPLTGPASARGQMRISNKFLKKKSPKKTPMKNPMKKRKKMEDDVIEEITIDDDDSVGYVSQSDLEYRTNKKINAKANKFIDGADEDFDSDVSLDC